MRRLIALTLAGAIGFMLLVAPPARAAGSLVFATFNVCGAKPNGPCAANVPPWETRHDAVQRVISESGADVLGLQEITNNPTAGFKTQVDDVKNLLSKDGYVAIDVADADNQCARPRDANGQLAGPSPCENTAMLAYRAATVHPFRTPTGSWSGRLLAGSMAAGLDSFSASRSVEFAYLQGNNGAGPFLAISAHTATAKDAVTEASRVAFAAGLTNWVAANNALHGMENTPAVLLADLNSYAKRQPNGAQKILTNSGWVDAFTAPTKTNVRYSTIAENPANGNTGWPVNAYLFPKTKANPQGYATRIDYIMGFGPGLTMVSYEHVIYLNGRAFNPAYQASDHIMVRATIAFG